MSPAGKYWLATFGGVTIFAVGFFVWVSAGKAAPTLSWGGWAVSGLGWALYYFGAAWFGRCPACGEKCYRDAIFSEIAPTCPNCGRDRYATEAAGDRT